ncbi:MAG: [citrate (pro-3S)-lyase] ligase [Thermoanaerobacteraceae bacterium]|nr:[citrate (pro-3S)-lyase] ligase [Thermoanaerobacteraceae bacterium]
MRGGLLLKEIDISSFQEKEKLRKFLEGFDLTLDEDIEESVGIFDGDVMVATCSLSGKVLKGFAVRDDYRGLNLTSTLVSEMIRRLSLKGIYKSFIFTKPENRNIFESVGYKFLASGGKVILLEHGINGIDHYIKKLEEYKSETTLNGCIVMNCNPFTLGHRYLIERAVRMCDRLYIFIVQEDRSLFPFDIRKKLIEKGTSDIENVVIIDGADYIISSATFPGYFIRKQNDRIYSEAALDIDLFTKYIAPVLNIKKRFAGSEPYDPVTSIYNRMMSEKLPQHGIEFIEVPRLEVDGKAVSASRVRDEIRKGDFANLKRLLPETTLEFLSSDEGRKVVERIKNSTSPH